MTGILFPFLMTTLGAAIVFVFRQHVSARAQRVCLGFAAGVMTAATAFSLLVPAAEQMEKSGQSAWLAMPVAFLLGAALVFGLDALLSRAKAEKGADAQRRTLFYAAVTLHNIPEGMAVGLALAAAGTGAGMAAAAAVSLGIGLQNLPEGAAVALPLRQSGMSRWRSFLLGMLSGAVEPAAAVLMLVFAALLAPVMPALMAFAAGAMIVVVFEELCPEATGARDGAMAAMIGFALMMAMDIGLG